MKQDEHAIIIRILDGEEYLYGILIDRYKIGLYHHCFKFVHDEDWAEDITQEAFIKAYVNLEKYKSAYSFSTWLYKIATNIALQEIRKQRPFPLDEEIQIISTLAQTDQLAINNELHRAVGALTNNHRLVITKYFWQGKSYKDIAKEMNTSIGNVKGWMSRAKKQLKEILS